eukprot:1393668-Amorphochlora_amoeboformis.AAC.1
MARRGSSACGLALGVFLLVFTANWHSHPSAPKRYPLAHFSNVRNGCICEGPEGISRRECGI